uniref:HTH CENPB-type domain-containing protein n=1 Tax=Eptatretus burgeri TaxID=7764 RepID=A0A8C4RBY2_EPTBU
MHQARSSRGLGSAASLKKMPRSRKVLTFEDRVKTIHLFDTGKMSLTAIAEEMDITNAQATIIIKKRKEILSSWESGSVRARQKYHIKRKNVKAWKLGLFVWQWYHEARARNICVDRNMIRTVAKKFGREMNMEDVAKTTSWFAGWKHRFHVQLAKEAGKVGFAEEHQDKDLTKCLKNVYKDYEKENIFAAHEMGLLYRKLPGESFVINTRDCKKGKYLKEQITVLLCCSATGEKLTPLIVGTDAKPECFGGHATSLPITYRLSKKGWMTLKNFDLWLEKVNSTMMSQSRKILLLLDDSLVHPEVYLSHVKLLFIRSNMMCKLHPCAAGIVRTVKSNYRKRFLRHVMLNIDEGGTPCEIAKSVTLLDVIKWIKGAWDDIQVATIVKVFHDCRFGDQQPFAPEIISMDAAFLQLMNGVTWEEYLNCDAQLIISKPLSDDWEEQLFKKAGSNFLKKNNEDLDKKTSGCDVGANADKEEPGTCNQGPCGRGEEEVGNHLSVQQEKLKEDKLERNSIDNSLTSSKKCMAYLNAIMNAAIYLGSEDIAKKVTECQSVLKISMLADTQKLK